MPKVATNSTFNEFINDGKLVEEVSAEELAERSREGLRVKVDDIELGMDPPYYTIRTLDALKKREPGNDFTLVIGADNLAAFRRWRDYRRILLEYGVAVYPRRGVDAERERALLLRECPDYRIRLTDAPMVDISSTEIREGLSQGRDMSRFLM